MTLRELRSIKGWTQKELASRAGVSEEVIARMERGRGNGYASVGLGNSKKVADTLGITLDGLWEILSSRTEPPKQGNNTLRKSTMKKKAV